MDEEIEEMLDCDHKQLRFVCLDRQFKLPEEAGGISTSDKNDPELEENPPSKIIPVLQCDDKCECLVYGDSIPGTVEEIDWDGKIDPDSDWISFG